MEQIKIMQRQLQQRRTTAFNQKYNEFSLKYGIIVLGNQRAALQM